MESASTEVQTAHHCPIDQLTNRYVEQLTGRRLLLLGAAPSATTRNSFLGTPAGTRISARALATYRQAPAMAQATIRADFGEPLDVQRHLAAQITFDLVLLLDQIAQQVGLGFGQVFDARNRTDTRPGQNLLAGRQTNAINVR